MSAHSGAVASCSAVALADQPSPKLRRLDQWIAEIEDHIGELEGHIRELSLAGQDIRPASFNLQKLEILLEIAQEAKSRV